MAQLDGMYVCMGFTGHKDKMTYKFDSQTRRLLTSIELIAKCHSKFSKCLLLSYSMDRYVVLMYLKVLTRTSMMSKPRRSLHVSARLLLFFVTAVNVKDTTFFTRMVFLVGVVQAIIILVFVLDWVLYPCSWQSYLD